MARPEKPIRSDVPELAQFATKLRELRRRAGNVPYRQLSTLAHYSPASLSEAAAGKALPTWEVVEAFVRACGGEAELPNWGSRWAETERAVKKATARSSAPPPASPSRRDEDQKTPTHSVTALRPATWHVRSYAQSTPVIREVPPEAGVLVDPIVLEMLDENSRVVQERITEAIQKFGGDLRELWSTSNRSMRTLAKSAGYAPSTVSTAMSGKTLPTWNTTRDLLEALGVPAGKVRVWHGRHQRLRTMIELADRRVEFEARLNSERERAEAAVPGPMAEAIDWERRLRRQWVLMVIMTLLASIAGILGAWTASTKSDWTGTLSAVGPLVTVLTLVSIEMFFSATLRKRAARRKRRSADSEEEATP